jgi:2-iminobutanoate/2-iminopropanoate deaminase
MNKAYPTKNEAKMTLEHECGKKAIQSEKAPKAIGPYSIGVSFRHFVFTSGQLGLDPVSGNLVDDGIEAQTRQALENVKTVLDEAGTTMDNVVKTTVFLKDINDFARMNAVYGEFFSGDYPARSAVQVAALPKGGMVEIEVIAALPHKECNCEK